MLFLYITRIPLEEFKDRHFCDYTQWISTTDDELCAHCIRIISLRLCIDEMTDLEYWKYMNATVFESHRLREKCVAMYSVLFEEYFAMGGPL